MDLRSIIVVISKIVLVGRIERDPRFGIVGKRKSSYHLEIQLESVRFCPPIYNKKLT